MSDSRSSTYRSTDQQAFPSTDQSANQHSAAGPKSNLAQIFAIMPRALELSFGVDISSVPQIRIHYRRIQHIALAIRQNNSFGKNPNHRLHANSSPPGTFYHP